ncbi:hypothetical protein GH733_002181 [Mirounga leonina]|nr:hypothetical protein GH733_002181 [Mirounga leonina]
MRRHSRFCCLWIARVGVGGRCEWLLAPDNLFATNQNGCCCHSLTSLDRAQVDLSGRIRNGSVYSAHSTNSLNNPQPYLQPSPMSSNPSITGSDVMRPDYVPSHRHSALIPPSYRPTPDYETVMKQLNRGMVHAGRQSHSLRNLNIGNSYAYSRPDALVYSQPEIREHAPFASPQSAHYPFSLNYSFHSPSPYPHPAERRPVVGAVSVPELTNAQLQAQDYPAPNIMRTQVYRPPPPHPPPRPANSTPDLSRHLSISSSNPDLITRRVHHSVQTFQEASLPVAHSLQEVSEPLTAARRAHLHKRNSIEVAGLAHSLEGLRLKERTPSASAADPPPRPVSAGSQPGGCPERAERDQADERGGLGYGHKKSLSDATMLIHSSEDEEDLEEEIASLAVPFPQARTPRGRHSPEPPAGPSRGPCAPTAAAPGPGPLHGREPAFPLAEAPRPRREGLLTPSVSESDLTTSGRYRARRDSLKQRPVSDLLSGKKNVVEGLPPLGVRRACGCARIRSSARAERRPRSVRLLFDSPFWPLQLLCLRALPIPAPRIAIGMKKSRVDAKKIGPLKLAALNGLSLSRLPLPDEGKEVPARATNDERVRMRRMERVCKILEQRLEQGMVFTEYEKILKKRLVDGECSTARLPENAERNRFQDVLPYDDARVELVPTKENNTGYINASHIKMVWEQGIAIIAMVTAEEEGGREKSFRYWPRLGSRHNTVTYGRFKITTRFRTDSGCYATTGLKLKHLLTGQERTVWHLQYTDWPEHGCPEGLTGFLSYLEEIQSVRRHTNSTSEPRSPNPPLLVHCSAGVGRTGVVILSEIMIACLEHNEVLDIPRVLDMLRQQRMMMVQTLCQYTFVYRVLIQFLKSSRLI